jgi:cation-transporting ATPase 13A1
LLRGGRIDDDDDEVQKSQKAVKFYNTRKGIDRHMNSNESSSTQNRDLPTVKAILVHRRVSIPQFIRLISAFLLTSSLLECLRTSGLPYKEAVLATLKDSGMPLLLHGCKFSETDNLRVTAMDEYFAKKICQSGNNLLPPKYLPSSIPLLGLGTSIAMYVGLLMLCPRWFVAWDVMINYQRFDIHKQHSDEVAKVIESYLQYDQENDIHDEDDVFYQSRFVNQLRPYSTKTEGALVETGMSVLIELSMKDKEMRKDGKSEEILRLYRSESDDHPARFFFETGQKRVYVNLQIKGGIILVTSIDGGPNFYQTEDISALIVRGQSGLANRGMLEYAQRRYGPYNELNLPIPTVSDAFIARVSTPLAVMQLLGRMLTALEESFIPALMNIFLILWQHYSNAKKSILSIKELSNEIKGNVEGQKEQMFWTLRPNLGKSKKGNAKQWVLIPGQELLPGDVFYLPNSDFLMPVDALLIEGSCFAKEAAITGESIPQIKLAVEADCKMNGKDFLLLDYKHRNSILFAGTDIISCSDFGQVQDTNTIPKKVRKSSSFAKCLVLRTGSYSSKGEIVRALSRSSGYTGGISNVQSDRDAMKLIGVLSICATFACLSLFIPFDGLAMKKTSGFRRFVQCTRIAIASIPSDLPIALNAAVYSCSAILRKEADVVCSDPGSLLTASQIDMVVYDKTGTLTSDTQSLTKIATLPGNKVSPMAAVVLAGCHSLSAMNATSQLLGDPLDLAGLQYSNWTFRGDSKTAVSSRMTGKIWQIKSFPFDANKRMSSALVLLQQDNGRISLWKLVKGAAESIRPLLEENRKRSEDPSYLLDYDEVGKSLESEGNRCIALAVQDISNSTLAKEIFPAGLPTVDNVTKGSGKSNITKVIAKARLRSKSLVPLSEFEKLGQLKFVGYACFKTSVRPSTPRVIREIKRSGTKVCMLTGDSAAAALSVAKETGFCDDHLCKRIAVLDLSKDHVLKWTILNSKQSNFLRHEDFTLESIRSLITKQQTGRYAIMITGDGVEALLNSFKDYESPSCYMLENFDKVSVFARTSPQIKQQVLTVLKLQCKKKVMMCGDGVNDISAMKTADISAALLSGYGKEEYTTIGSIDNENERRKARLKFRKIGKLRDNTDFGTESQHRIRMKLEAAMKQSNDKQLSIRTILNLAKDEYKRAMELRKGGASAARILQREESLRKAIISKNGNENVLNNHDDDDDEVNSIKPGEASLAAPFTFLRPCIDGTESIIRSGIAAAAFSLSSHRYDIIVQIFSTLSLCPFRLLTIHVFSKTNRCIALNSFMSCCNLASLYHDGFRYGKHMWNVELAFMMLMDNALMDISCLPRARISNIRPRTSIFHPAVALSVVLQGIIHLFVLNKGVHGANILQSYQDGAAKKGLLIRLAQSTSVASAVSVGNMENVPTANLLGRTPFKPNHVTNVVFLLSIFQNTMISIMNHCGLPFHGSLLESKTFCLWSSMSILFVILLALELQPSMNKVLQLAPMNSRPFLTFILLLFAIDGILVFLSDRLCVLFLDNNLWSETLGKDLDFDENSDLAADVEEKLLKSERNSNKNMIQSIALFSVVLLTKSFLSSSTS